MLKIESQAQFDSMVRDGVFSCDESVEFPFNLVTKANIIIAGDIKAGDINAEDINAEDINAEDIIARDINAEDINAGDIKARDIIARDIIARDIKAKDIIAGDISFYAICFAYQNILCKNIKGERGNSKYFALDGEVEIG